MNVALAQELAVMVAEDQRVRRPPSDREQRHARSLSPEQVLELARTDVRNTDRLREIIEQYGWPGRSLVGEQGARDAWLLAQHADRQLEFQRRALRLLAEAVKDGEATHSQLAYLTDRVRINEGRHQVFGTQVGGVHNGKPIPFPIEEPDGIDARRAEMGLSPLCDYLANFVEME